MLKDSTLKYIGDYDDSTSKKSYPSEEIKPNLPAIINSLPPPPRYIKLSFSYILKYFLILWLAIISIYIIRFLIDVNNDVHQLEKDKYNEIRNEIKECEYNYERNKCDHSTRLPSSEEYCIKAEKCKNRDPTRETLGSVQFVKVIGMVTDKFFNEFSSRTLFWLLGTLLLFIVTVGRLIISQTRLKQA